MPRQTPLAFGVLAACAVIASGSILLREQILSFTSWPEANGGGGGAPEIAIPHVRSLALDDAVAPSSGSSARRAQSDAVPAALRGAGGGFTLLTPRPAGAGGGSPGTGSGQRTPSGAAGGEQFTSTGRIGSGHPNVSPVDDPLSVYGAGIPLAGNAGSAGSGVSPYASGAVALEPTAAVRVAAPHAAEVAPQADPTPVVSSADNAPSSDPSDGSSSEPEPAPDPEPTPPAPDPEPAPAEPTPPADPTPPVETPAPPTEETPDPPAEAPAPEPAPEVPPAPADPTPPADPTGTSEPAPAPPEDPALATADPAAAESV